MRQPTVTTTVTSTDASGAVTTVTTTESTSIPAVAAAEAPLEQRRVTLEEVFRQLVTMNSGEEE